MIQSKPTTTPAIVNTAQWLGDNSGTQPSEETTDNAVGKDEM